MDSDLSRCLGHAAKFLGAKAQSATLALLLNRGTRRRHVHPRSQEAAHRYPVLRETSQGGVLLRRQDTPAASAGRGGRLLLSLAPAALRQEPAAGYPGLPLRGARGAVPRALYPRQVGVAAPPSGDPAELWRWRAAEPRGAGCSHPRPAVPGA